MRNYSRLVKLLKTIRADRSDTFIFDRAAQPGEWAVSGAFMFAHRDPATLTGKVRAAFRGGFLGIDSFGWSTLAQIVEANEADRSAAVAFLAGQLVALCAAPDLISARAAAEEEIAFAQSLCEHPPGMLVAVSRRYEADLTHEAFRTLQSGGRWRQAPAFTFVDARECGAAVSTKRDFWLACGHHLLDRGADGGLMLSDEFLKAYLARPEMTPSPEACRAERELHRDLLADPRRPIAAGQIATLADADARENWGLMVSWRNHLARHATLEAAYLAIVRQELRFPHLFLNQLVQVILRNALDDCEDAFMLRAAELFFRPQKLTTYQGTLMAADQETASNLSSAAPSPLTSLLGLNPPGIDLLSEDNAASYWERSDRFDLALDLTAGRRGLAALGEVVERWVHHLLEVDVAVDAVTEVHDVAFSWYVGLDAHATRIGDALWNGDELDQAARERVVGLYRLTFPAGTQILEQARGAPTYLLTAMSSDRIVWLKPQNLITGLPVLNRTGAVN